MLFPHGMHNLIALGSRPKYIPFTYGSPLSPLKQTFKADDTRELVAAWFAYSVLL